MITISQIFDSYNGQVEIKTELVGEKYEYGKQIREFLSATGSLSIEILSYERELHEAKEKYQASQVSAVITI